MTPVDFKYRELRAMDVALSALEPLPRKERWRALLWLCRRLLPPLKPSPPADVAMREQLNAHLNDEPPVDEQQKLLPPPSA